MITLRTMSH